MFRIKVFTLLTVLMFTVVIPSYLSALECSASANALNGIVSISESVADYSISPLIGSSGLEVSYFTPFSISEIQTFGIYSAYRGNHSIITSGISYLMHDDYKWQDNFAGFSLNWDSISLGATQHLTMDYIRDSGTEYEFSTDIGCRIGCDVVYTDLVWQRGFSDNAKYYASLSANPVKGSVVSVAYTRGENDRIFGVAGKHRISPALQIISSWQNNPARLGVGIELKLSRLKVLYSIRTHPELNMSHAIDLGYEW